MLKKGYLVFSALIFSVLFACGPALAADTQGQTPGPGGMNMSSGYGCMNAASGGMDMDVPSCGCMNAPSAGMGYGCGAGCGMMGAGQSGSGCGRMKGMMGCRMEMPQMGGRMGMMGEMGGMRMMRERAEIMSAMGITAGPAITPFASPMAKEIMQDPEVKQFLDQTKDLRMELVRKRFDYYEALRDPSTKPEEIIAMRKELRRLQKDIHDKAPFARSWGGPEAGPMDGEQ